MNCVLDLVRGVSALRGSLTLPTGRGEGDPSLSFPQIGEKKGKVFGILPYTSIPPKMYNSSRLYTIFEEKRPTFRHRTENISIGMCQI